MAWLSASSSQRFGWTYQNLAPRTEALAQWQHHCNCHHSHGGIGGLPHLQAQLVKKQPFDASHLGQIPRKPD